MKLRSGISKSCAPVQPPSDLHQTIPVTQRRSSRLQSVQYILGSYFESQRPLKQRPADTQTLQAVRATKNTRVPTSSPVEAFVPVPLKVQLREYLCPLQSHNLQTRNQRPDRSIETGAERPPKRARLTEKNLKKLEKMGRPRKSNRKKSTGHSSSIGATTDKVSKSRSLGSQPKSSNSTNRSTRSKETISTTDSGFPDTAFQNGVLNPNCSKPPANLKYRQDRLDRSRGTASPSESHYRYFASAIRRAPNEASVVYETSTLLKRYTEPGYHKSYNQPFSNFPKNVGFNNGLSAAQPDMVEGLDMPTFEPFPVREQLGGAATVYSGPEATTLSHIAGEWKGPGKDMILAQTQAAYDAACMVYGRNEACLFLKSPDPTGYAYIQTFTTDGTTFNTFAHYSTQSKGQVKYHQYPTSSSFLISSYPDFKNSRRRLRNIQDDAKEESERLRDELIKKWSTNQRLIEDDDNDGEDSHGSGPPPMSLGVPAETADSADDNNYEYEDGEDPTNQLLTEHWTSFLASNQEKSCVQIAVKDSVYAPPSANSQEYNQEDPFIHVATTENGYTLPDALTVPPIPPPQSTEHTSFPFESSKGTHDSYRRSHRRTRRSTRAADPVEGTREGNHNSESRRKRDA